MSRLLWGIGNLVEDPSNTIINSLRKHIFNSGPDDASETDIVPPENDVQKKKGETKASLSTGPSCSTTQGHELLKSKSIQFGTGLVKRRHLSIQCSKFPLSKIHKTTSVPNIQHRDKGAGTTSIEKKHAYTEPYVLEICGEHQHALQLLRKWPAVEKVLDGEKRKPSTLTYIKTYLFEILNLMKLEKIQSVPQYKSKDMEVMKLYKKASVEETQYVIQQLIKN